MNVSTLTRQGGPRAGREATGTVTEGAARAGLAARGVIYLLVGTLALQIAFGEGHRQADRGGALAEIADKPFGAVVLWALAAGLAGMALWRLSEAVLGAAGPDGHSRANASPPPPASSSTASSPPRSCSSPPGRTAAVAPATSSPRT